MSIHKTSAKIKEGIGLIKAQGPLRFTKEATQYIFWELIGHRIVLPSGIKQFKKKTKHIEDIKSAIDFAFTFNYFGLSIRPGQFKNEITQLLNNVRELEPKHLMEIGTAKGGTLFLFCQAASLDAQAISVDLPGGKFGGGYSSKKSNLYRAFAKGNQEIVLIRKNAHDDPTLNEVKKVLAGLKLDFLFIDGDHTYEGVKKDFEMYSPLVRKGGIVAFHDIAKHPEKSKCEVNKFWDEIKCNSKYIEFITDVNQGTYGIGMIYV